MFYAAPLFEVYLVTLLNWKFFRLPLALFLHVHYTSRNTSRAIKDTLEEVTKERNGGAAN